MNARAKFIAILIVLLPISAVLAESAASAVRQGNMIYKQSKYNDAIKKYDEALAHDPLSLEAKFDKANSCYRLDDLANASDLYKSVAADSRDMKLVEKAKYNLGNCSYQQGLKQKDSDLQKALEDFKTSIGYWRQALDIDPQDENAAKNIEVARLMIKDVIDQINKQKKQQDPNNSQNNKQQQNQQQKQQDNKQQNASNGADPNQQPQQKKPQPDPNKTQEPNQPQKQQQKENQQDQKKAQEQKQQSQEQKEKQQQQKQQSDDAKKMTAPDATAQEILDREQKDRKERELLQRGGSQKVDKDW